MERATEILLEALKRSLAASSEQRLYRSGKLDGLFPGKAGAAGTAAADALRAGLLEVVRIETRGKSDFEWVRLTPRGVNFIHEHESPVQALRHLRADLRLSQQAVPAWLAQMQTSLQGMGERLAEDARRWSERLEGLTRRVEETLRRLEAVAPLLPPDVVRDHPWAIDALNYLDRRRSGGAPGDCPLPELFAALANQHAGLSMRAFHEGLRRLNDCRAVLLKPADRPGNLPQPEFALFDDGMVLYYAGR